MSRAPARAPPRPRALADLARLVPQPDLDDEDDVRGQRMEEFRARRRRRAGRSAGAGRGAVEPAPQSRARRLALRRSEKETRRAEVRAESPPNVPSSLEVPELGAARSLNGSAVRFDLVSISVRSPSLLLPRNRERAPGRNHALSVQVQNIPVPDGTTFYRYPVGDSLSQRPLLSRKVSNSPEVLFV